MYKEGIYQTCTSHSQLNPQFVLDASTAPLSYPLSAPPSRKWSILRQEFHSSTEASFSRGTEYHERHLGVGIWWAWAFLYCNIKAFIISYDGGAFLENNRTLFRLYIKETPLWCFRAQTGITEAAMFWVIKKKESLFWSSCNKQLSDFAPGRTFGTFLKH